MGKPRNEAEVKREKEEAEEKQGEKTKALGLSPCRERGS